MLFAKLLQFNSPHFDLGGCVFSERNMMGKAKEGPGKEGSGRVAIHHMTGLTHCYTMEINYNAGKVLNKIPPKYNREIRYTEAERPEVAANLQRWYSAKENPAYTPSVFKDMGRAIGESLLDLTERNPASRLNPLTHSLQGLREEVRDMIRRERD